MHFDFSPKVQELQQKLTAFMNEYIYPNEKTVYEQLNEGDRWQPIPLIE